MIKVIFSLSLFLSAFVVYGQTPSVIDSNAVKTGIVTFSYVPFDHENPQQIYLAGSMNGYAINHKDYQLLKKPDGSFSLDVDLKPGLYYFKYIIDGKWVLDMADLKGRMKPTVAILGSSFEGAKVLVADNGIVDSVNLSSLLKQHTYWLKEVENLRVEKDSAQAVISWALPDSSAVKEIAIYGKATKSSLYRPQYDLLKTVAPQSRRVELSLEPLADFSIIVKLVSDKGEVSKGKQIQLKMKSRNVVYDEYRKRGLYIYFPPGYDAKRAQPYPVVYMLDGQNLFSTYTGSGEEWRVDEVLDSLIHHQVVEPMVVVGIAHGSERAKEYIPYNTLLDSKPFQGAGAQHARWITQEVVPYIERKYHVAKDRKDRAIFGNSLGGILSLWMIFHQSDFFATGASISPAPNQGSAPDIASLPKQEVRLWLDAGTDEIFGKQSYIEQTRNILNILQAKGYLYEKEMLYYEVPGVKDHRESVIAQRIAYPFIFFKGLQQPSFQGYDVYYKLEGPRTAIINPVGSLSNGLKYSLYTKAQYSFPTKSNLKISKAGVVNSFRDLKGTKVQVSYKNSVKTKVIE